MKVTERIKRIPKQVRRMSGDDTSRASAQHYFDRMAGIWDQAGQSEDLQRRLTGLIETFAIPCGGSVLDVGAGTGVLHPYLLDSVGKSGWVLALDFSIRMLSEALKKKRPANLICFQADVAAIPLADRICDTVICFAAFPHFDQKAQAIQEMARVLKVSGRIFIAHLMSRKQIARHHDANPEVEGHYLPPADTMRRLFITAGLSDFTLCDEPGLYLAKGVKHQPPRERRTQAKA
jgi:ubiquinone/menaquinone biosynthesis C-methylase UbiE